MTQSLVDLPAVPFPVVSGPAGVIRGDRLGDQLDVLPLQRRQYAELNSTRLHPNV